MLEGPPDLGALLQARLVSFARRLALDHLVCDTAAKDSPDFLNPAAPSTVRESTFF